MANSDGSVVIGVDLNASDADKELAKLKKKIESLEESISEMQKKRDEASQKSVISAAELDAEKAKLQEIKDRLQDIKALSKDKTISPEIRESYAEQILPVKSELTDQQALVRALQTEYNKLENSVERYDQKIAEATERLNKEKETAGERVEQINAENSATSRMAEAADIAGVYIDKFTNRLKKIVSRVFVFTIITAALRGMRTWMGKVVKTNGEATAALAKLKGALLTLAQPLVNIIIPAFTTLVNLLTILVTKAAEVISALFGSTLDQSREAAEGLYNETEALEGTGEAAEDAEKSMASFDEINQLSADTEKDGAETAPDFTGVDQGWLSMMMGKVSDWVPIAVMLGGIALVAIGAATGNLALVVAGLIILLTGFMLAEGTGQLQSWVDTLGLNSVTEFVVIAILLAGIAIVAIGAAMGNILMVIAGLVLIGVAIAYMAQSGMLQDWAESLGLSRAAQWVTAALLIGGMVLIVIGAITKNYKMLLAGLGLIAAGVFIGIQSGVFESWWEALELSGAEGYITAGLLIAGFALVVFGIVLKNIAMIVAGIGLFAAGVVFGAETGTFENWWEVLHLSEVAGWVTAVLLLGGIALTVFGILLKNIKMFLGGMMMLFAGITYGTETGTFDSWWSVLGIENADYWVTAALLIGGIGLIVIGIITANILMFVGGLALLAVGTVYGTESGTFENWWEALGLDQVEGWVSTALLLGGIALVAIGAITLNPLMVLAGLGLLGASTAIGSLGSSKSGSGISQAKMPRISSIPSVSAYNIPALATGAVIPPNREFLAVLGDQNNGTNIEAPVSEIEAAVARGMAQAGGSNNSDHTVILQIGEQEFGRLVYRLNNQQTQRVGVRLAGV